MSHPFVRFRLPDGTLALVAPGGVIGRLATAACRIQDPRVSEIHGLVSLRGRELQLLAMRGPVRVAGEWLHDVALESGLRITLVEGLDVEVAELFVPGHILALELPSGIRAELFAPFHCLVAAPELDVRPGFWPDALARLWSNGQGWSIELPGRPAEDVRVGRSYPFPQGAVRVVSVETDSLSVNATRRTGWNAVPMTLILRVDTVQLIPAGRPAVVIDNLSAELLRVLHDLSKPSPWQDVAEGLWRKSLTGHRPVWDQLLRRIRRTLRENGIREDLVRTVGRGNVELYLLPGDRVVDETLRDR